MKACVYSRFTLFNLIRIPLNLTILNIFVTLAGCLYILFVSWMLYLMIQKCDNEIKSETQCDIEKLNMFDLPLLLATDCQSRAMSQIIYHEVSCIWHEYSFEYKIRFISFVAWSIESQINEVRHKPSQYSHAITLCKSVISHYASLLWFKIIRMPIFLHCANDGFCICAGV